MREGNIDKILAGFKKARVAVVGDVILDHFIWGTAVKISPEAPVPVVRVSKEDYRLGGAGNVLANMASLGADVSLFSVIGEDESGCILVDLINHIGGNTEGVVLVSERPTIRKSRVIAHSQQIVRIDREEVSSVSHEAHNSILNLIEQMSSTFDVVVVSDYAKGLVNRYLIRKLREVCPSILILVDPKHKNPSTYIDADVLTPNDREAESLSGIQVDDESSVRVCAEIIMEKVGCSKLLITRGSKGMSYIEKGIVKTIPTVAKEVYDITGAGDTVIGVLALGLASGLSFEEAVKISNVAAGIVVGKVGTSVVTEEDMIEAYNG